MSANDKQIAGSHYKTMTPDIPQHWDIVALHNLDYFQGQITKYVMRWKNKNGIQDLQKALHFLEKYIELNSPKEVTHTDGLTGVKKYPDDYQEQLATKMAKMRNDAMIGIPDHLREAFKERSDKAKSQMAEMPESLQGAISPMLKNFWGGEEPMPHGYVNQDGPDVR